VIVLDTHALLWWLADSDRLGPHARHELATNDRLGVPAIVFWEIALLARRKRIEITERMEDWVARVLSVPRVASLDLTPEIAVRADRLAMHPDPADRFIAATAISHRAALVTRDAQMRDVPDLRVVW
jgi:PIN domain nuclease of toxin-antitoxin system